LLFIIAVPEIFGRGTEIYSHNFKYFEVLCVVSLWYLLLTGSLTVVQEMIERRLGLARASAGEHGGEITRRRLGLRLPAENL
jgi:polar amino acid transport system permease protein